MKKISFVFLLQLLFILVYSQNSVTIAGKVINTKEKSISILTPVNDVTCWLCNKQEIKLGKDGEFFFKHSTSNPGFYYLFKGDFVSTTLFLDRGDSCYIILDGANNNFKFQGNSNWRGAEVFNEINDKQNRLQVSGKTQFKDYSIDQIRDSIIKLRIADIHKLNNLRDSGFINDLYYMAVSNEIAYKYAIIYYDITSMRFFMSDLPENHPQFKEISEEDLNVSDSSLSQMFSFFKSKINNFNELNSDDTISDFLDFQQNTIIYSGTYLNFVDKFIHYKGIYVPHRNNTFDINAVNKNLPLYFLNLYSRYLQGKDFEYAVGAYFSQWLHPKNYKAFTPDLIKPYYSFKKYYPDSPFIPSIDAFVKQYKDFNEISITDSISGITYLEGTDTIKSLESLVNQFKGGMIYIDIWASNLGQSTYEFKYYPEIYQFLSINDIKVLYISFDKKKDENMWNKTINKYNLIGYHLLASAELAKDIKNVTKMSGLPWYIIVDKEGNLSDEFIYGPRFKEKLYDQFSKYLNK